MVFFQLDLIRFLQIYVIQGIILAIFIFLAYKILKRNKKLLNVVFSGLYISEAIGLVFNMIYAVITDELTVLILNFVTNYTTSLGPIFLLVFNLILLKSEKVVNKRKATIIILRYAIILFLMIFFLPFGGVTINESTSWKPVWSLPFYLYVIAVITIFTTILLLITSFKIYKRLTDENLKKKWKYFIIGVFGVYAYMYGAYTANMVDIPLVRTIFTITGLTIPVWIYLIYYGVGLQTEK